MHWYRGGILSASFDMRDRRTVERIKTLHKLFLLGGLRGPERHEVYPNLPLDGRENYLYFTLPCCVNFQRSSPAMWRSALETFEDSETNYVFFPERVCNTEHQKVAKDLIKHRLALQTNKHPQIWRRICETLHTHYDDDPRRILKEADYDVRTIIHIVQVEKKNLFPYLGGIKLSNYWLFILSSFTDVQLKNPEQISIIPDTHVVQSTVRLGLAFEGVSSKQVETIWKGILAETGIPSGEMHSALWRWSRSGFSVRV